MIYLYTYMVYKSTNITWGVAPCFWSMQRAIATTSHLLPETSPLTGKPTAMLETVEGGVNSCWMLVFHVSVWQCHKPSLINHHFYAWYKPSNMGGVLLLYPHYHWFCKQRMLVICKHDKSYKEDRVSLGCSSLLFGCLPDWSVVRSHHVTMSFPLFLDDINPPDGHEYLNSFFDILGYPQVRYIHIYIYTYIYIYP